MTNLILHFLAINIMLQETKQQNKMYKNILIKRKIEDTKIQIKQCISVTKKLILSITDILSIFKIIYTSKNKYK